MPVNEVLRERTQAVASTLNSHRVFIYTLVSTLAVSAAIANALKNQSNFYSVAIYLSKSSRSVLILANFGLILSILCGRIIQQIFFGALRPAEVERLYDRLWFFVTESLLAFTIFRDEFDIPFALMFGFLLFIKSFHWLSADRIEWMDQTPYPGPPTLFHVRMHTLFFILWATDLFMFALAVENTLVNGVGGMVLFASEYAILTASVLNAIAKYLLSWYDIRRASRRGGENAPPWENKSMWLFYIELATDFLKLSTYLVFFTIIITFYGLPLNIVRDVYITARSFITRLRALHRYQTATRNMDERYPNATEEEMLSMSDRTCIICREEMVLRPVARNEPGDATPAQPASDGPNTTPKKLPCGHIFHFHCLRSWLERQQSCPTCRRTVLDDTAPQGQPAAPGVRIQPQLGAVPQQRNPFGFPGGAQQPMNNPLGFVGRLFGGVAQPPNVGAFPQPPGPVAAANIPQVQNGWGQGQQPPQNIIIQYHIQYQVPRQQLPPQDLHGQPHGQTQRSQLQRPPQPQPQPLQPPPMFAGFHGPGGVWQPWGMDPRWIPQHPQHPAQLPRNPSPPRERTGGPGTSIASPTTPTPSASSPPAPVSTASPTPTSPPVRSQSQSSQVPSASIPLASPANNTPPQGDRPSTPRDAAAQAALRRFGKMAESQNSPTTPVSHTPSVSPEAVPSQSPSASPTPNLVPPNGAFPNPDTRLEIPTMIPLFDYGSPSSSPLLAPQGTNQPRMRQQQQLHSPYSRPQQGGRAQPYPQQPGSSQGSYTQSGPHRTQTRTQRQPQPQVPISQLPPTLTDEQLAVMDRVTREAIDERLRVLEGVSGAVFRCIEDLLRMRSALPTSAPVPSMSPIPNSALVPPDGVNGSSHVTETPMPPTVVSAGECDVPSASTLDSAAGEPKMNGHSSIFDQDSGTEPSDGMAEPSPSSSSPQSSGEEPGPPSQP